ncbi:hypothetical protein JAAARDRAFT_509568 [Jaapia argillacea MUCL 33604]|uniref:Uncharacterized protein n=1 Tax=Jaapia argillacea MUCL 33604 TaxID=933084 RepID=A0A067Q395_9AGAM|nr:hypothetical protein JAAARDRAFT_509568 [Jaapia argillacea MUCL 33604]
MEIGFQHQAQGKLDACLSTNIRPSVSGALIKSLGHGPDVGRDPATSVTLYPGFSDVGFDVAMIMGSFVVQKLYHVVGSPERLKPRRYVVLIFDVSSANLSLHRLTYAGNVHKSTQLHSRISDYDLPPIQSYPTTTVKSQSDGGDKYTLSSPKPWWYRAPPRRIFQGASRLRDTCVPFPLDVT